MEYLSLKNGININQNQLQKRKKLLFYETLLFEQIEK